MKFKPGDIVQVVANNEYLDMEGMRGVYVDDRNGSLAVSFYNFTDGHTCSDLCKNGTGWWMIEDQLKLSKESNVIKILNRIDDLQELP